MPFKSDAQRKYFNANRDKLEAQGVNVDEWNQASKGLALPKRIGPPKFGAMKPKGRLGASLKTNY